jgi:hypothetical protein
MKGPIRYVATSSVHDEELPDINLCVAIGLLSALASCAHSSIYALYAYEVAWQGTSGPEARCFCDEVMFPEPSSTGI